MWIRAREGKRRTIAGREFWPKLWQDGANSWKDAVGYNDIFLHLQSWLHISTVKNTPLISDAILDEKSLTGLFSDQLNYSSKSHRVKFHKEEITFKYKEPKKSISNFKSYAGLYYSRLYCADIKVSTNQRLYDIWHCQARLITSFQPRFQSGTPGTPLRLRGIVSKTEQASSLLAQGWALDKGQTSPSPAASFCNHALHYLQTFICLPAHLPKQSAIKLN